MTVFNGFELKYGINDHSSKIQASSDDFPIPVVIMHAFSGGSTGGGGGFRGFKPPLGLPSKNLMCIEKRHHNMSRPTLCSYSTLSQAQPQTVGFNPPPPPLGLPSEHVTLSWTAFYGLHCVSRCQENITTGVQNSKKNRLGHQNSPKKIGSPLRGSDIKMLRIVVGSTPPLGKKLDPPLALTVYFYVSDLVNYYSLVFMLIFKVGKHTKLSRFNFLLLWK